MMKEALIVMISTYVWNLGQSDPMAGIKDPLPSRIFRQWEYSLRYLLSKLRNVLNSYARLMQNKISEFYIVLLSAVFVSYLE